MAFINPFPLISTITRLSTALCNSFLKNSPISYEFCDSFSSSNISKAVIATLQPNGLPPNVEPCVPFETINKLKTDQIEMSCAHTRCHYVHNVVVCQTDGNWINASA